MTDDNIIPLATGIFHGSSRTFLFIGGNYLWEKQVTEG